LALAIGILLMSCNSVFTPKPKGYFKIDFPEHRYVRFEQPGFPYTFEYPAYAQIVQDSTYFDYVPENAYWRNIDFPQFDCRIFLSYKQVGGKAIFRKPLPNGSFRDSIGINLFDKMVSDAFKMTYKNEMIATKIDDSLMRTANGVNGVYFKLKGNTATARQFFLTDTTRNFLRGALYFHATPNADSIAPVQAFVEQDMKHIINTFRWVKQ
jgi:gliding motility-associated lipoprotein GldD